MTEDDMIAELQAIVTAGMPEEGSPEWRRVDALNEEMVRRADARRVNTPVEVEPVAGPTARPRLYTYQRRNLVALNLDTAGSGADLVVKQAAARVRNRMPLTGEQASALAAHLHQRANNPDLRVQQQRSTRRLAVAFDISAGVAAGRGEGARQPGNTEVRRVRPAELTGGDTAVIRMPDGSLATVRVHDAQQMMRGTLARLTVEHDDGTTETRLVDRDTDVWLMPDLPDDKTVPPPPRLVRELVYADDIRVGDRVAYMAGGMFEEGVVRELAAGDDGQITVTLDNDRTTLMRPGDLRTRVARGDGSVEQPYWLTFTEDENAPLVRGGEVRAGDFIEEDVQNVRGTVLSIDTLEAEGGGTGVRLNVADESGSVIGLALFDPQTVTRWAAAGENAAHSITEMRRAREARERRQAVVAALRAAQTEPVVQPVTRALGVLDRTGNRETALASMRGEQQHLRTYLTTEIRQIERNLMPDVSSASRDDARALVHSVFDDAVARLNRSIEEAQPLPGEDETATLRRLLEQHRDNPPTRDNDRIARALLEGSGLLTAMQPTEPAVVAVSGDDLATRVAGYRQMIGGRFGHEHSRRATFGDLDLDALERGEPPAVVYRDVFDRARANDGGPSETAMRHLDAVQAAGADMDAAVRERETALAGRRLSDLGVTVEEGEGFVDVMTRLREQAEALDQARSDALQRVLDAQNAAAEQWLRANGWPSTPALLDARARELLTRRSADDAPELRRLDDLRRRSKAAGTADPAAQAAKKEFQRIRGLHEEVLTQFRTADRLQGQVRRDAVREVLASVRRIGGEQLSYQAADSIRGRSVGSRGGGRVLGERAREVVAMRTAENVLPDEWVAAVRGQLRGEYRRTHMGVGTARRGFADYRGNVRLSTSGGPRFEGDNGLGRVAVHELGHFVERAVPGMLAAEEAFLWSRTSTGEVGSRERERPVSMRGRGGDSSQYGYLDEFPEAYSGVDYQRSSGGGAHEAYEVLTTGLESVFAGSGYLDDDYRRFMLGVLATL
jgi:hypothetical protein